MESVWKDVLFAHGKKYEDDKGDVFYRGGDVTLTLDHTLQMRACELLQPYGDAALVVMDQNGEVLVMAESNTFDIRNIGTEYESLKEKDGVLLNSCIQSRLPVGSVLKPVWAQLLLQKGYGMFTVYDTGMTAVDGVRIRNSGGAAYGTIGMREALVYSSNVYFAEAAQHLGSSCVHQGLERFGADNLLTEQNCLAMTAIGQDVLASPLQLTALVKAETTGEVIQPYYVSKIAKDGNVMENEKKLMRTTGIDEVNRVLVNTYMQAAAESYGLTYETCGTAVCAKTGTAEYEVEGQRKHIATITAAWPADSPAYFMTVQLRNTDQYGSSLAETAAVMIRETVHYSTGAENVI